MEKINRLFERPEIYQLWNDALHIPAPEVMDLIGQYETVRELMDVPIEKLQQIRRIGPVKAKQIKAILQLAKELASLPATNRITIRRPQDVADILMPMLRYEDRERFIVLHLNVKNQIMKLETVSIGILSSAPVHPREVFKNAIINSAAGIILGHGHPSGDPNPSSDDLQLTQRLKESGELLGIRVIDHIIVGDRRFVSLKEQGHL